MRFTPHLMTQALKRGISPNDPRYAAFAEQTEAHEAAEDFKRRVRAITRGRTPEEPPSNTSTPALPAKSPARLNILPNPSTSTNLRVSRSG